MCQNSEYGKGCENASVTYVSKYAKRKLDMSEQDMDMLEYVWTYNKRHGFEYVISYNT